MDLNEIYYYCISIVMIAGVRVASALHLDIDQNEKGRMCISFQSSNSSAENATGNKI